MKLVKVSSVLFIIIVFSVQTIYADFSRIDRHALNAPSDVENDINILASYLVKPAESDKEKIRAIFRWVTENITYDVESYLTRDHKMRSPERVLKEKTGVCDGYAALIVELGKAAGLDAVRIIGYSKGYDYKIGDRFSNGPNHAWNAVKINGQWQLMDATWGAGYIDENNNFVRRFQEHYFLTPAKSFLLDHLPEDERWQLVDDPITLKEFENYLYLKPAYFEYGLSVKSHYQHTIKIHDDVKVEFYAPDDVAMSAQLYRDETPLPDYLTFCQPKSGQYIVLTEIPEPGKYILRLYAKNQRNKLSYDWIMDYNVIASGGKGSKAGFPVSYAAFNEHKAYLYQPVERTLEINKDYKFKVFVPGALDVSVKVNDQWHSLEKQGSLFEGYVRSEKGVIQVLAKFEEGNAYSGLLNYVGN